MNDFQIGEGDYGVTAIVYPTEDKAIRGYVSQNSVSYWCYDPLTNTGFVLMKNTPEAQTLTDLLGEDVPNADAIHEFILDIILKHMSPSDLINLIEATKRESYTQGVAYQKQSLRECLGL